MIEESRDDYYDALKKSSQGWFKEEPDLMPWWNYFIGIIKTAYFELKVDLAKSSDNKSSILRKSILTFENDFSISDIMKLHSSINRELIKKVLTKMRNQNLIQPTGKGRTAKWKVIQ